MMNDVYFFQAIEYRNGLYEGITKQSHPQGLGLFFDDDSAFYCSIWQKGVPNGRTVVFLSQAKYFYGEWRQSKPHGFNVFRSADIILLGNYSHGKLTGRFVIVFQKQGFVTIVSEMNQLKQKIQKKYFSNQQELKDIINRCFQSIVRVDDYFQLLFFLKNSFCLQNGPIKLELDDGDLKFGYHRGLGVLFDDDNFIRKVGFMNQHKKLCGLGVSYGITNQEGNFQTGNVINYNIGNRPSDKIKALFKGEHIKSIFYRNDFVPLKTSLLVPPIDQILRKLITKISELPKNIGTEGEQETAQELNDSLQYHPRNKTLHDIQKIKKMRFQLDHSIGKVGTDISSPFLKYEDNRTQLKQLYFTPLVSQQYLQPQGIRFDKPESNRPYVNRQIFLQQNKLLDYRRKYDTLLVSPNESRAEESYLDRNNVIKKIHKKQPSYVQKNRQKDRLLQQENQILTRIQLQAILKNQARKKQEEKLMRQKQKQKQIYQQIERQIQIEKQKQNELNRERQMTFAMKKEVEELPNIITKLRLDDPKTKSVIADTPTSSHMNKQLTPRSNLQVKVSTAEAPAQTSFSVYKDSSKSSQQISKSEKQFEEKATAIKPQLSQIHYNPFLRTFVSSKYPPLITPQQPFKNIQVIPNLNDLNLRPTLTSQQMDQDSLQKIKQFKLTQYKPPRYLIQGKFSPGDTDNQINIPTPKKKVGFNSGNNLYQSKSKQIGPQSITRQKSKSYLEIYQTSTNTTTKHESSKSPLFRNMSTNKVKKVIQSPYTPTRNRHRDYCHKKITQIEHQRISPSGKKTNSYERIVKKVQYSK